MLPNRENLVRAKDPVVGFKQFANALLVDLHLESAHADGSVTEATIDFPT